MSCSFDPDLMGSLPDLRVPDCSVEDWQAVLDLVMARDKVIDFDVDLRELQGQERLDALCVFLGQIGRRLSKPVRTDPEGDCGHPVLGFDVATDRIVLLAEPLVM